jgi:hypothetical protein
MTQSGHPDAACSLCPAPFLGEQDGWWYHRAAYFVLPYGSLSYMNGSTQLIARLRKCLGIWPLGARYVG